MTVFAQLFVLLPVDDVGPRGAVVVGADQHLLDDVLDAFDLGDLPAVAGMAEHLHHLGGEQLGLGLGEFTGGAARLEDRGADLAGIEFRLAAVALLNLYR